MPTRSIEAGTRNGLSSGIARALVLLAVLLSSFAGRIFALDPTSHISQYGHSVWRVQDGAFRGAPNALAQTKDGYLWMGTDVGLVRFDGTRFVPFNPPTGARLLDPRVFSLLGARDGSLWIGTGYSISHWRNGELRNYPELSGRIEEIAEDSDGAIWLVRTQITDGMGSVCRIRDENVKCYGQADGIPFAIALRVNTAGSGELWIGGYSDLCRWKPESPSGDCLANGPHRPETFASLKAVAPARDGTVWAAMDRPGPLLQLQHFEKQRWETRTFPQIGISNLDVTALFVDRDNSVWIGTAHHGIFHVAGGAVDNYRHTDGLSSDAVGSFYQDAEGTVWVLTSGGVDNLHEIKVTSYSLHEGLSAAGAGSVLATRNGIWIGNFHALDLFRDGKLSAIQTGHGLPGQYVTTFFEDHSGGLWVGLDNELWIYRDGVFRAVRHADGSPLGTVFGITEDTRHNIWVRAGHNLDRISGSRLLDETTSPQISTAYALAANPQGGFYLGLVDGSLIQYTDGETKVYPSNELGNTRQIRDLLVEADGSVWGTTLDELARWKDGMRRNLTLRNGLPCDGIFALVEDDRGSLWLDSKCGLIGIERSELDRWWQHPESVVKFRLLDALDGVQAGLTPLKPQATRSQDGRLWFVNGRILQVMDPAHLHNNPVPPPVRIEGAAADRKSYSPHADLQFPALTRDLEIDYTALSFVAPQKVLFRYMLEGHDSVWEDAGTRRQAFYNDLRPGHYTFRVMACNNDGLWNEAGASLAFSILPAYYQTVWFRIICALAFLGLLLAIYQFRVQQLRRQFAIGLEARVNERTRIARELHDTVLQSLHGLLMSFQRAANLLPERPVEAKQRLEGAIDQAAQAITEGREAVQELRSSTVLTNDLGLAIRTLGEELASKQLTENPPVFNVAVEGTLHELNPILRDDVYRIAGEALRNAFNHAQAQRIEADIHYDQRELRLRIRDDGKGVSAQILADKGRSGHWGLQGMRERAKLVGGHLEIWSELDSGTEIELRIPASIAYLASAAGIDRKRRNEI